MYRLYVYVSEHRSGLCLPLPLFVWKLSKYLKICQLVLILEDSNTDDLQGNNALIDMQPVILG